jgi:hypothetical protein
MAAVSHDGEWKRDGNPYARILMVSGNRPGKNKKNNVYNKIQPQIRQTFWKKINAQAKD